MSLLLFALLTCGAAASGVSAGLLLRRGARLRQAEQTKRLLAASDAPSLLLDGSAHEDTGDDPLPTLAIGLGDVVSRGDEDAALAEALVLSEDGVLHAALLRGAGPASAPWLWSAPPPATEAVWLHEVDAAGEPTLAAMRRARTDAPLSLEIGARGAVFERRRRLPVVVTHIAPVPTDGARSDAAAPDESTSSLRRFAGDARIHEYVAEGGQAAFLLVHADGETLLLAGQVCAIDALLEHRLPGPRRSS